MRDRERPFARGAAILARRAARARVPASEPEPFRIHVHGPFERATRAGASVQRVHPPLGRACDRRTRMCVRLV
eukprot:5862320-Pleurochrysis_carterae.AAC.1